MSTHPCLRCGFESRCSHGSWPDRHPVAAVVFAVPVAVFALGAVCANPWLLVVIVAAGAAYLTDREHRRRRALAARADWEHHTLMNRPIRVHYAHGTRSANVTPRRPRDPAAWHLISQLPTQPLQRG